MRKIVSIKDYKRIRNKGVGFIYNDFSPSGNQVDFNILHRADCDTLARSNLNVDKYYFRSRPEAQSWLEGHRGGEGEAWRMCMICLVSE